MPICDINRTRYASLTMLKKKDARQTLKSLLQLIRDRWDSLNTYQAIYLGAAVALVTGAIPGFVFGDRFSIIGFLLLFPFWTVWGLRVLFVGPFLHQLLYTKYGWFCVSWFLTFSLLASLFFDLD